MKLLNVKVLYKFLKRHKTAESELKSWKVLIENTSADKIHDEFKIRIIKKKRLIFKIGDQWRIDTLVDLKNNVIVLKRIGTHEEYNKWKYDN